MIALNASHPSGFQTRFYPLATSMSFFGSGEKIEPRPVPTDAPGVEASRDAKSPNIVGHAASAKTP
jgi:hypothetical protein